MSNPESVTNSRQATSASGTLELAQRAAREGAADAREAARRISRTTSLFVSRFVYTTCYTISYGVVFPAVLLAQAVPRHNAAVRGLIDGASAAMQRVDQLVGPAPATRAAVPGPAGAPA
jgi:hypothetical protein